MEKYDKSLAKLHIFMCVNDRSNLEIKKDSCGPKISTQTFLEVKKWIHDNNLSKEVYITRTFCLGACNSKGGSILIYPKGKYFISIENSEEIIRLINEELNIK